MIFVTETFNTYLHFGAININASTIIWFCVIQGIFKNSNLIETSKGFLRMALRK